MKSFPGMFAVYYVIARLKEPSSYAALGPALLLLGVHLNDGQLNAVIEWLMAGASALGFFLPEANPDRD